MSQDISDPDEPEPMRDKEKEACLQIKLGDYCLVRFALKKNVYYVGKIRGKSGFDWEIDFYGKCISDQSGDYGYILPQNADEGLVSKDDIECVLKVKDTYKGKDFFDKAQFDSNFMLR